MQNARVRVDQQVRFQEHSGQSGKDRGTQPEAQDTRPIRAAKGTSQKDRPTDRPARFDVAGFDDAATTSTFAVDQRELDVKSLADAQHPVVAGPSRIVPVWMTPGRAVDRIHRKLRCQRVRRGRSSPA